MARRITYRLWKGKGGNNISKEVWTLQGESLTGYGKEKVATTSARKFISCNDGY